MKSGKDLKIFICDEDLFSRHIFVQHFYNMGVSDVSHFDNYNELLHHIEEMPDVVFLSCGYNTNLALNMLDQIKYFNVDIYVIVLAATHNKQLVTDAHKRGAFDFLNKEDTSIERLKSIITGIINIKKIFEDKMNSYRNTKN